MDETVKLSRLESVLSELSYPISREAAAAQLEGVTLLVADGEEDLGAVVAGVGSDSFDSVGDLRDEVFEYLPGSALGEPGQSEGDA